MRQCKQMLVSACAFVILGLGLCTAGAPEIYAEYSKQGNMTMSVHAKERMNERSVTRKEIKSACLLGDKFYDHLHRNDVYYYKNTGVFVSVKNGTVVTVIRKESGLELSTQKRYTKVLNDDGDRVNIR